eukprot:TRINITY_DN76417_c0_g1_i1.p1 TRINITY_DN76417_c0_g1~~TRINITY_DN76417_c0_g1_i1.p1  ORF type:complete len:120 (+),score=15.77 TRINITY_DN76417_c0_g1_i1:85-444(+)
MYVWVKSSLWLALLMCAGSEAALLRPGARLRAGASLPPERKVDLPCKEVGMSAEEMPPAVRSSLDSHFPGRVLKQIQWECEHGAQANVVNVEVEFTLGGHDYEVDFWPNGTVIKRDRVD